MNNRAGDNEELYIHMGSHRVLWNTSKADIKRKWNWTEIPNRRSNIWKHLQGETPFIEHFSFGENLLARWEFFFFFRTPADAEKKKLFVSETTKRWARAPTNNAFMIKYFWHTVGRKRFSTGFVLQSKSVRKAREKLNRTSQTKVIKSMTHHEGVSWQQGLPLATRKMSCHFLWCRRKQGSSHTVHSGLHTSFFPHQKGIWGHFMMSSRGARGWNKRLQFPSWHRGSNLLHWENLIIMNKLVF